MTEPAVHIPSTIFNNQVISQLRAVYAMIAGTACGILGLTGWWGFAFYFVVMFASSLLLWWKMGGTPLKYFGGQPWMEGVLGNIFSYILFWTLAFSVVHVYE
jgi:hypothetical protein